MAKPTSCSWFRPITTLLTPRGETLWYFHALLSILSLLGQELSRYSALAAAVDFEGFGDEAIEEEEIFDSPQISDLPFYSPTPPPPVSKSDFEIHHGPSQSATSPPSPASSDPSLKGFEYWDEDEFEGLPVTESSQNHHSIFPNRGSQTRNFAAKASVLHYGSLVSPLSNRKWVLEDMAVIFESREVAGDLITETRVYFSLLTAREQ